MKLGEEDQTGDHRLSGIDTCSSGSPEATTHDLDKRRRYFVTKLPSVHRRQALWANRKDRPLKTELRSRATSRARWRCCREPRTLRATAQQADCAFVRTMSEVERQA